MAAKYIVRSGTKVTVKLAQIIEEFRRKGYSCQWIALKTGLTEKEVNNILNVNND